MEVISIPEYSQDTEILKAAIMKEIKDKAIEGLPVWDSFFNARVVVQVIRSVIGTAPVAINLSTIPAYAATAL